MNETSNSLPRLRLTTADHERLRLLVDTAIQSQPRLRETLAPLQAELKRAEVLAQADIPSNVVIMGATVQIEDKESGTRSFTRSRPTAQKAASPSSRPSGWRSSASPKATASFGAPPAANANSTSAKSSNRPFHNCVTRPSSNL